MRWFKSIWLKCQSGLIATFFAAGFIWLVYQFYWVLTEGLVQAAFPRDSVEWISYQSDPVLFIASLMFYCFFLLVLAAIFVALVCGWFGERQRYRRLRSRPPLDAAIRRSADDR